MSARNYYSRELPALRAIPEERVSRPALPIAVYVQEARNLYRWTQPDRGPLAACGLDWRVVRSLPSRTGALHEAESIWSGIRDSHLQAARKWREAEPGARTLRANILETYRFAFRKVPSLLSQVVGRPKDVTQYKLIQELNDLAVVGRKNLHLLIKVGFDRQKFDQIATHSATLSRCLALRNDEDFGPARDTRDRAYTHLSEAVEEVRLCGRYAFRADPARAKGYSSEYWRRLNRARPRKRRKSKAPAPTPLQPVGTQSKAVITGGNASPVASNVSSVASDASSVARDASSVVS